MSYPEEIEQSCDELLMFFKWEHLPEHLQDVSKGFCEFSEAIMLLPNNEEKLMSLRKLLEAKDCAVRACL